MHQYRVGTKYYRRVLGEKAPRESFTGRETTWRGTKMPRPGVQDDQAPTVSPTWTTKGSTSTS